MYEKLFNCLVAVCILCKGISEHPDLHASVAGPSLPPPSSPMPIPTPPSTLTTQSLSQPHPFSSLAGPS